MANKNLSVTYYQTPKEVFWPIKKNCVFSASGCSSAARHGGRVKIAVGSSLEGSSTFKNCPSRHKYKTPKQFELNITEGL